jgi:hypothetical protein
MEKWFRDDSPVYFCKGCGKPFHWSDVGHYDAEDSFVLDEDPHAILCDECALNK